MAGYNDAFPYRVPFKRTSNWWNSHGTGDWAKLSSWCDQTIPGEWEFFNSEFCFTTERAKMLFMLKWAN